MTLHLSQDVLAGPVRLPRSFVALVALCCSIAGCASSPVAPGEASTAATASAAVAGLTNEASPTNSRARFADVEATQSLVGAIDERLTIMRDVAAAKWLAGAPVYDAAREVVVLQQVAARARALGLDPATTQAFLAEQIRLARDVQQRWHDQWKQAGRCAPCEEPAGLQVLRERIDATDEKQFAAMYLLAPLREDTAAALMAQMQATALRHGLTADDAIALLAALRNVVRIAGGPVLDRVQASHVLRVATTGDYAPFSLETHGRLSGADIALARGLAAHLGAEPVFVRTSWPGLANDLRAGRFDVALSGIGYTEERAALGLYSAAYHEGGKTLLARCADRERFDTPAGLDRPGVRVIVNPGGTNERYVREHVHRAQIVVHPDNRGVFAEIAAGRADVMVTDDVEAELQARRRPGELCRTYPGTLTRSEKRILMARDPALQAVVNGWLAEAIAAGESTRELELAMQAYVAGAEAR
ncbi:MAG: transporter substrate-binding domain-containing protein [Gammaproteobacteria bacterium]|nr:transporter substrate-binding domain-containing protein [Gammaproteobacteria bacterium]